MIKGATVIVSLALVWGAGCSTHSAIGDLNRGGAGGNGYGGNGQGGGDVAGSGMGGSAVGGSSMGGNGFGGGDFGLGGSAVGGNPGYGGSGVGGSGGKRCDPTPPPPPSAAKTFALQSPMVYPTGGGAFGVATGDLNGDNKLDLVLLDNSVGLRVLYNNGNGTFTGPIDKNTNTHPTALALGDFNSDQRIDIATVGVNGVSIFTNLGNGDLAPPVTYVAGNGSVALTVVGDPLDIAVANMGIAGPTTSGGDVGLLSNSASGTFSLSSFPAGQSPAAIAAQDLDGDCWTDYVVAGDNGLTLLQPVYGFSPANLAIGTVGGSVAIGDINGDGKPDLVEGGSFAPSSDAVFVLINLHSGRNASNMFSAPVRYGLRDTPDASGLNNASGGGTVALADMDGDGRKDLITAGPCCGLSVLLNHGDGTFAPSINYPFTPLATSLAYGDFNGDGLTDVAVVGNDNTGSTLRVFLNASH